MSDYRRPGVYLEERLQTSPTQAGTATAVGVFAGVTAKGPGLEATPIASWTDFVQKFGGFDTITADNGGATEVIYSYLPHAVYNYYQNGGRLCWVVRALPGDTNARGERASTVVYGMGAGIQPNIAFVIEADGVGIWGNDILVRVNQQALSPAEGGSAPRMIFGIAVFRASDNQLLETFNNLSMTGVSGTRPAVPAINDSLAGSRYINLIAGDQSLEPDPIAYPLGQTVLGVDPAAPGPQDLVSQDVTDAMRMIENPLIVSVQPFRDANGDYVLPPITALATNLNSDRHNCFVVWDGHPQATSSGDYKNEAIANAGQLVADSYSAFYCPWVVVPDPSRSGATINVPPSGSVMGMMARMDATIGPWRAPAGMPAVLSTAVTTELKFTDTDQGELNYRNINVVRAVIGGGICVMGARTRKLYGPDRYVSARRTLIYIEEAIKLSTQWAVFENNDQRLWSSLTNTVINLLNPIWEAGGLAGHSAAEAYYVICDRTINTPQVVQSGEVRMEVGVALQYPAEFVVIRVSQFDSGASLVRETVNV